MKKRIYAQPSLGRVCVPYNLDAFESLYGTFCDLWKLLRIQRNPLARQNSLFDKVLHTHTQTLALYGE